jgi:arylsulfatase A-like enzyme
METFPLPHLTRALAALALAACVAACSDAQDTTSAAHARNVVLILADDLGYADVSTYSGGRIPTPSIDRIGREGVTFTNGYVTASVCSPSRASLLTGRYQQRFGFEFNAGGSDRAHDEHLGLDVNERTLGDLLRDAGLRTAAIGKWHQGSQDEFYPTTRGFEEFFGFLIGQTAYADPDVPGMVNAEAAGGGVVVPRAAYGELGRVLRGPQREVVDDADRYLTEEITAEALAFIERNREQPFFLYLAHHAPHLPFQVPQRYYDRFPEIADHKLRVYAAMVSALDDGVGAVLDKLDELGLARNTLVLFLSDNGCATYTGVCSCEPLRGGKLTYLEGGIRVPFVMRWPAGLPSGLVFEELVSSLDVVPTVLGAVGAELPADRVYDGVDLLPYLRAQEGTPHERLFWRTGPLVAMREGRWKLVQSRDGEFANLFDLAADPTETTDASAREPGQRAALEARFAEWEQALRPPLWDFRLAPVKGCGENLLVPF